MRRWIVVRPPGLPVSFRLGARVPAVLLALTLVTLAGMVLNVGYGEYPISPPDVVRTVLGIEAGDGNYGFIVNTLRLPRVLVAFAVGVALAVAGAILQGITRNPLAAPEIVGVNAGAGLAAVTLIVALPAVSVAYLPFAAFGGALVVATLVYLISWKGGGASPIRLILVGIGFAAMATALTTIMITFGEIYAVQQALVWLSGSVYARGWAELFALLPWLALFLPLAFAGARQLNALNLGDDVARSLGGRVELQRLSLIVVCVALAGAAVATAGAIGFVGLMAPHIARRLVGPSHEGLIPVAAMTGGMLVVLADLVGRAAFSPIEIPCGLITSAIGAPYFLYLLYRSRNL
ncbi:iron ABC transporter permease [Rubrobacter taiwanensis]|uniref:Iron ABC transporter permease n=1 Tax=Rubrobacter taiwanensis TaxID=185139 RepID=A0A4R1B645_9ACTN|nr:iron ABC transporter permease [Rubrobacter taiwanensis]TCJ13060.1 iron ABC transporter permease [Rubrobacter taiwanensis]